jgi:hypothetical protein
LAEMIAAAWKSSKYRDRLLHDTAQVFKEAGLYVDNPVVVTETEFKTRNFTRGQQTLFVLPDAPSEQHFDISAVQGNLIDTVRVKMAYTCMGI